MKNFFKILLLILVFLLNFLSLNLNLAKAEIEETSGEQFYKDCVLDRIDGPDIPPNVKKFANDNNCFDVTKSYYWTYKIFKNQGGVYCCGKDGKAQYIYAKDDNMRFARWYEKLKFRKVIYEF